MRGELEQSGKDGMQAHHSSIVSLLIFASYGIGWQPPLALLSSVSITLHSFLSRLELNTHDKDGISCDLSHSVQQQQLASVSGISRRPLL
jgi:hypothetical protein